VKNLGFAIINVLLIALAVAAAPTDNMANWRNNRFGMFIHWGAYAQAGGVYTSPLGGQTNAHVDVGYVGGNYSPGATGEWLLHFARNNPYYISNNSSDNISPAYYKTKYSDNFIPHFFIANDIVVAAKNAGMKYLVVTAKHHDGFCMWNTSQTYDGTNTYKFGNKNSGQNPIMDLKNACAANNIMFGIYYSIWDMWHPAFNASVGDGQTNFYWGWNEKDATNKQQYMNYMKNQLGELIDNYNPQILWFDGGWPGWYKTNDARDIRNFVLARNPNLIINDRSKGAGYFSTPEQALMYGPQEYDWESCMTMNNTWGYKQYDTNWKSVPTLIRMLVSAASRGGNYLLNIGPDNTGTVPQASLDRLNTIGNWMVKYSASIYGTTPAYTGYCPENARISTLGNKVLIHVLYGTSNDDFGNTNTYAWPASLTIGKFGDLKPLPSGLGSGYYVYMMNSPTTYLPVSVSGNKMTITLPTTHDAYCDVIVAECLAAPVFTIPVASNNSTPTRIEAEDYVAKNTQVGGILTSSCSEGGQAITNIYVNAWLDYDINVPATAIYQINYRTACPYSTGKMDFIANGATLASTPLTNTGSWNTYADNSTQVELQQGTQRIRLHASGPNFNINYFGISFVTYLSRVQAACGKIEAENASTITGMTGYACTDIGGGYQMGSRSGSGTLGYNLDMQSGGGGKYKAELRVACPSSNGAQNAYCEISLDNNKISKVYVPPTGAYNKYMTVKSQEFSLLPGPHSFKLTTGWEKTETYFDLNWFKLTKSMPNLTALPTIEAEAYDCQSGTAVYQWVSDQNNPVPGQFCVGAIHNGDWLEYKSVTPSTGNYLFKIYTASPNAGELIGGKWIVGKLDVIVNGDVTNKVTVNVEKTDGWYKFRAVTCQKTISKNTNIIRLVSVNTNWYFNIDRIEVTAIP
jgi:alpha-L-fucosidase